MTCEWTRTVLRKQLNKWWVFMPSCPKTLRFKRKKTQPAKCEEEQCGFGSSACCLFTGTTRVKKRVKEKNNNRAVTMTNTKARERLLVVQILSFKAANKMYLLHEGTGTLHSYTNEKKKFAANKLLFKTRIKIQHQQNTEICIQYHSIMFHAHFAANVTTILGNVTLYGSQWTQWVIVFASRKQILLVDSRLQRLCAVLIFNERQAKSLVFFVCTICTWSCCGQQ